MEFPKSFESFKSIKVLSALMVSSLTFTQLKEVLQFSDGELTYIINKLVKDKCIKEKKFVNKNRVATRYSLSDYGEKQFSEYVDYLNTIENKSNATMNEKVSMVLERK